MIFAQLESLINILSNGVTSLEQVTYMKLLFQFNFKKLFTRNQRPYGKGTIRLTCQKEFKVLDNETYLSKTEGHGKDSDANNTVAHVDDIRPVGLARHGVSLSHQDHPKVNSAKQSEGNPASVKSSQIVHTTMGMHVYRYFDQHV